MKNKWIHIYIAVAVNEAWTSRLNNIDKQLEFDITMRLDPNLDWIVEYRNRV